MILMKCLPFLLHFLGYTPLMSAILDTKSEKLINLLLHHGADINKVYKAGMTALHIVINAGS